MASTALEARVGRIGAALVVAVGAQALSFLLYSHAFWLPPDGRWQDTTSILVKDPFSDASLGEPQVQHRILGPLVAHLLGLRGLDAILVWIFAGTLLLILTYLLVRRTLEADVAALSTLLIATTLVVITSQTWFGYPDAVAYLAVLCCMVVTSKALVLVGMAAAMFADERAAAAIPLILAWHFFQEAEPDRRRNLAMRGLALAGAMAVWGLYYFGRSEVDLGTARDGLANRTAVEVVGHGALGLFFSFRAAWLLPLSLALLWWRSRPATAAVLLAATAIASVPALLVVDVSRVGAFGFPILLFCIVHLGQMDQDRAARLVSVALMVNLVTPAVQTLGTTIQIYWPLPVSVIRAMTS